MNAQATDLLGVYVPTLGLLMLGAFLLLLPARWLMARLKIYAFFWHRGLVDLSVMVLLSAGLFLLFVP